MKRQLSQWKEEGRSKSNLGAHRRFPFQTLSKLLFLVWPYNRGKKRNDDLWTGSFLMIQEVTLLTISILLWALQLILIFTIPTRSLILNAVSVPLPRRRDGCFSVVFFPRCISCLNQLHFVFVSTLSQSLETRVKFRSSFSFDGFLESSENIFTLLRLITLEMMFIETIKRSGHKTILWGTPLVTFAGT